VFGGAWECLGVLALQKNKHPAVIKNRGLFLLISGLVFTADVIE